MSGSVGPVLTSPASSGSADRLARLTGAAAVVWGGVLLVRGRDVWRAVDGRAPGEVDELALRFLGVRHLVQGGSQLLAPARFQQLFIGVDVVHALSMAAVAALDEPRRRPALLTGGAAAVTALLATAARRR